MQRRLTSYWIVGVLLAVVNGLATAQEPMTDQQKKDLLKSYYRDFASRIHFALDEDRPLRLVEKPVMSWTGQEQAGTFTSGDVFVWERGGRAEIIGCIGSLPGGGERRSVFQEFHTLATGPIQKTILDVEGPWEPKTAGVEMKDVATKIKPAGADGLRLAQMRRVANEFTAYMQPPGSPKEERLRLLPQPVYRFDSKQLKKANSQVVDGAVFAYVWTIGTDPELLLLVECHNDGDGLKWKYAPVRFTYRELRLEHKSKEVWQIKRDGGSRITPYRTTSGGIHTYAAMKSALAQSAEKTGN